MRLENFPCGEHHARAIASRRNNAFLQRHSDITLYACLNKTRM